MAAFVAATLAEDMGSGGDITSAAVIPVEARLTAVMDSRDPVVVAGLPLAAAFFRALDPDCTISMLASDGDAVPAGLHDRRRDDGGRFPGHLHDVAMRQLVVLEVVRERAEHRGGG